MQAPQLQEFADAADDGIVLVILRCLGTEALVRLASTSAFLSLRLNDGGPSSLHCYASELLGDSSAAAAAAEALTCGGALDVLRALAAAGTGRQSCEVLGLALVLASQEDEGTADLARLFLDAVFRWELRRLRYPASQCKAEQAADLLLTALLDVTSAVGCKLLNITAQAIRQAEGDLDALVEMQTNALLSRYEAIARQRSAAEFIRCRATASRSQFSRSSSFCDDQPAVAAMDLLEAATSSLDETIRGYDKEGYTLVCPKLVGSRVLRRMELPYQHWWVRLDGPFMGRPAFAPPGGAYALALCA